MSQLMQALLEVYQSRLEVYERTKPDPNSDFYLWEAVEMARHAVLMESDSLLDAIRHLTTCPKCGKGKHSSCAAGKAILRLMERHDKPQIEENHMNKEYA